MPRCLPQLLFLKASLALSPVVLATFVAVSRIADYKHNVSDVNAGWWVGPGRSAPGMGSRVSDAAVAHSTLSFVMQQLYGVWWCVSL